MKIRTLLIAALILFSFAPSASAITCGAGGTCKASCNSSETPAPTANFACEISPSTPTCCVSNSTICFAPGICQAGPTTDRPNLNPDPNINCGATDRCYVPAPATAQADPGTGTGVIIPPAGTGGTGVIIPPAGTGAPDIALINPLKAGTSLQTFLSDILKFVIQIGTIAVILMLVYVGYKFVVAQGAPGAIEEARKMLLWTVIGALILLGAQAIATAIQATVSAISS